MLQKESNINFNLHVHMQVVHKCMQVNVQVNVYSIRLLDNEDTRNTPIKLRIGNIT